MRNEVELRKGQNLEDMLAKVLNIQERALISDELVKARINKNERLIGALSKDFENIQTDVEKVKLDIENVKYNEEITDEQATAIRRKVQGRVSKVLGYPEGDSEIYYQTFISNIYAYLRNSHNLGSKIATTKKKHFDTVMDGIDAWYPNIEELKRKKDIRDRVRKVYEVKEKAL